MSLLNDALRGAEQRRERSAPNVYTGASRTSAGPSHRQGFAPWLMVGLLILLGAGAWLWWSQGRPVERAAAPVAEGVGESIAEGVVARESVPTVMTDPAEPPAVESQPAPPPEPEAVIASNRNEAATSVEARAETTSPAPPEPAAPPETASPERRASVPETKEQPAPTTEPAPSTTIDPTREAAAAPEPSEAELAAVKQQRETPELVDRRTDAELKGLLARGQLAEAEQQLNSVLADQPAPMSRARLARHLIIANDPARALAWLPESSTPGQPELRLLRARAQLALGNTGQALATLEQSVPPVSRNPEYLVTLAALLQQEGRANDAVGRWAELVAFNDSRAAWWVGLASALEADQQTGGAQRAYQQALELSDLSPTLADFCRQRLRALGAG